MLTLQNPLPQITSVSPTAISLGAFTITINGAHFAVGAVVQLNGVALNSTRISSTQLTATGTATSNQVGNVNITVENPNPGAVSSSSMAAQVTNTPGISVQIVPATAMVHAGGTQGFGATVTGTANTAVTWSVNNQGGGTSVIGYMNAQGEYSGPQSVPNPNTVTVTATSVADPSRSSSAVITLVNPVPVVTSVSPASIGIGAFTITVNGSGFVNGSVINFGGQTLSTTYLSGSELTADGSAALAQVGNVPVTVQNPDPGGATSAAMNAQVVNGGNVVSAAAAVRFIEQSTFGPTPEMVNQLQQTGFDAFLQNQLAAPASVYPTPAAGVTNLDNVQNVFFVNAINDPDQLRQRVAFALNEIWVVSENKVNDPTGYSNYMTALTQRRAGQLLQRDERRHLDSGDGPLSRYGEQRQTRLRPARQRKLCARVHATFHARPQPAES